MHDSECDLSSATLTALQHLRQGAQGCLLKCQEPRLLQDACHSSRQSLPAGIQGALCLPRSRRHGGHADGGTGGGLDEGRQRKDLRYTAKKILPLPTPSRGGGASFPPPLTTPGAPPALFNPAGGGSAQPWSAG
ncbi:hypothetical protein E2C01_077364 [Portunus trituberculatus]|uniref:Uncharacterized protein n=1 Tax=Portunus trituberculatus TaxID=210409 RepID=A0A5B7IK37_PORTR|nr:hypothetical protein [Portunus trituberculatus]